MTVFALDAGEFGWSLCALAPRLRWLAQSERVVVAAPADRRAVHADYAAEVLAVDLVPDASNVLDGVLALGPRTYAALAAIQGATRAILPPAREFADLEFAAFRDPQREDGAKRWRCMAPAVPEALAPVLVALRPAKRYRDQVDPRKAWPHGAELVDALLAEGLSVGAIGGPENDCPPGALDLRGIPLERLCAVIAGARVVVGPSSGPLHLAQLCVTPVVTWYGVEAMRDSSRVRYERLWNPFRAACVFLPEARPRAVRVARAVAELCTARD